MKYLTDNDLELLAEMWSRQRVYRCHLATWQQRAGDRLASAGILRREFYAEDQTGRGWRGGGNGYGVIFEYDPDHAAAAGDIEILGQILAVAPELLKRRPVGRAAQALMRVVK